MRVVVALLLSIFVASCATDRGYVDMLPVSPYSWADAVSIIYQNSDTVSERDIAIALRYNKSFRSDTLTVKIQTSLPDAHQFSESVLLHLKRDYTAAAVTASEVIPYRNNCVLGQSGYYIFTITPCRAVEGIEAVGIAF